MALVLVLLLLLNILNHKRSLDRRRRPDGREERGIALLILDV